MARPDEQEHSTILRTEMADHDMIVSLRPPEKALAVKPTRQIGALGEGKPRTR